MYTTSRSSATARRYSGAMADWEERAARARERYEDGVSRLPEGADERQRQLTRMGNAAWAAGLSLLVLGRRAEADDWLVRAAETYRRSWPDAPPGSWGRPIGAMKARLIAGDVDGARTDARWALRRRERFGERDRPLRRSTRVVVLADDAAAAAVVPTIAGAEEIPPAVTGSLPRSPRATRPATRPRFVSSLRTRGAG